MTVYVLRRLAQTLLVLVVTSALVFAGLYLVGDPVEILVNPSADQIEKERAAAALGLDKPVHEQYLTFLGKMAVRDLGTSYLTKQPVSQMIAERVRPSLELALGGLLGSPRSHFQRQSRRKDGGRHQRNPKNARARSADKRVQGH